MSKDVLEYRGVTDLVAAEVLTDDENGYTTGTPFSIAGVAQIQKAVNSSSEAHFYDNKAAVVISSTGADDITINASAIPFDVVATITGQYYDTTTGTLIEGEAQPKYFALGYKTQKTDGSEVYVWRLKGKFAVPDQTNVTKDNSTTANGQELKYMGVETNYKFTKTGKSEKGVNVDVSKNLCDVTNFFTAVTTPDTLVPLTSYKLTISQAANTTVTVKRNGTTLANNANIYAGDQLLITVTGGTVTVNSNDFISGDIHVVSGNTTVASTASA